MIRNSFAREASNSSSNWLSVVRFAFLRFTSSPVFEMGVIMNQGLFLSQDIYKRVCTGCFVMCKEKWQIQGYPLVVIDGGLQAGLPSTLSFHLLPPPQVSWEQNSATQVKGQPNRCSVAGSEKAEVNPAEATKHRKRPRPADTEAEASTEFRQGSRQTSSILCPVPRAGQQQQ